MGRNRPVDEYFMRLALTLAKKGNGKVFPNPMVGSIVVKNGKIIARGYHSRFGDEHAEVKVIKRAGENARGATIFVNLEPCCHYGKTPPCTKVLIESGIRSVVIAMLDPNPLVYGKGKRELEKFGINVSVGMLEEEARKLNKDYIKYMEEYREQSTENR